MDECVDFQVLDELFLTYTKKVLQSQVIGKPPGHWLGGLALVSANVTELIARESKLSDSIFLIIFLSFYVKYLRIIEY
jgi:hypothetical protein